MRGLLAFALGLLMACSTDAAPPLDVGTAVAAAGDPLLRTARETLRDGRLDPEVVDQLRGSSEPAHARARRILDVIDQKEAPDEEEAETAAGDALDGPAIKLEPGGEAPPPPAEEKVEEPPASSGHDGATERVAPPPAADPGSRAVVTGLRLKESGGDVTLTVKASGGVVLGIANQPRSGIVRLVIDSAGALPKVLSSRPSAGGVSVTSVSRGTDSVFVTLTLQSGWTLGRMRRMPGGAKVTIKGP